MLSSCASRARRATSSIVCEPRVGLARRGRPDHGLEVVDVRCRRRRPRRSRDARAPRRARQCSRRVARRRARASPAYARSASAEARCGRRGHAPAARPRPAREALRARSAGRTSRRATPRAHRALVRRPSASPGLLVGSSRAARAVSSITGMSSTAKAALHTPRTAAALGRRAGRPACWRRPAGTARTPRGGWRRPGGRSRAGQRGPVRLRRAGPRARSGRDAWISVAPTSCAPNSAARAWSRRSSAGGTVRRARPAGAGGGSRSSRVDVVERVEERRCSTSSCERRLELGDRPVHDPGEDVGREAAADDGARAGDGARVGRQPAERARTASSIVSGTCASRIARPSLRASSSSARAAPRCGAGCRSSARRPPRTTSRGAGRPVPRMSVVTSAVSSRRERLEADLLGEPLAEQPRAPLAVDRADRQLVEPVRAEEQQRPVRPSRASSPMTSRLSSSAHWRSSKASSVGRSIASRIRSAISRTRIRRDPSESVALADRWIARRSCAERPERGVASHRPGEVQDRRQRDLAVLWREVTLRRRGSPAASALRAHGVEQAGLADARPRPRAGAAGRGRPRPRRCAARPARASSSRPTSSGLRRGRTGLMVRSVRPASSGASVERPTVPVRRPGRPTAGVRSGSTRRLRCSRSTRSGRPPRRCSTTTSTAGCARRPSSTSPASTATRGLPTTTSTISPTWFRRGADRKSLELYLETFEHTVGVMQDRDAIVRVAAECAEDLAADGVVYAEVRYAPELSTEHGPDASTRSSRRTSRGSGSAWRGPPRPATRSSMKALVTAMRQAARSVEIAECAVRWRDDGRRRLRHRRTRGGLPRRPATSTRSTTSAARTSTSRSTPASRSGCRRSGRRSSSAAPSGSGHGVRIVDDITVQPTTASSQLGRLAAFVRDRRVPLEMCPTSNVHTGAAAVDRRAPDRPAPAPALPGDGQHRQPAHERRLGVAASSRRSTRRSGSASARWSG